MSEAYTVHKYRLKEEGFSWTTFARTKEEAEKHFRANLATMLRRGGLFPTSRSRAAKAFRKKELNIETM